jgi:hypothetical protein
MRLAGEQDSAWVVNQYPVSAGLRVALEVLLAEVESLNQWICNPRTPLKMKWGRKAFALLPQVRYSREQLSDRIAGFRWNCTIGGLANHTTLVREEQSLTGHVCRHRGGDDCIH